MLRRKSLLLFLALGACVYFYMLFYTKSTKGAVFIRVTSPAFAQGGKIPAKYTCDGANISPELSWTGVPDGTRSLALVCDDPDAPSGTWVHWVVFNLPATLKGLPEGITSALIEGYGGVVGVNSFKKNTYGGPCPPREHGAHRYFFKLYALDKKLELEDVATKSQVEDSMKGHVLGKGHLIGTYIRQ